MAASKNGPPKRACCMISEILEEAGIDRERARAMRRQVFEGIILLCQWQLERMAEHEAPASARRARKVPLD